MIMERVYLVELFILFILFVIWGKKKRKKHVGICPLGWSGKSFVGFDLFEAGREVLFVVVIGVVKIEGINEGLKEMVLDCDVCWRDGVEGTAGKYSSTWISGVDGTSEEVSRIRSILKKKIRKRKIDQEK